MGMSLALWMWKAISRVPSGLRYASTHALMRAACLRRSSSDRRLRGSARPQQHEADDERADGTHGGEHVCGDV
jgi:hypothetical protein